MPTHEVSFEKLKDIGIATPANISTVTAAVKAGKSAAIEAMAAATFSTNGADTLSFTSSNPNQFAVLHFDSEQSPADHWYHVDRIIRRAHATEKPAWLKSWCLTGLTFKQCQDCVWEAARIAHEEFPGILAILIDGYCDLVADVNDPAESNDFVARTHGLAIQYRCHINGVIHLNPGTEKSRGHLGSQLERKAESNLRLDKIEEITEIWSDKNRKAPILKGQGPCFTWSDEAQMHVSTETRHAAADYEKMDALTPLVAQIFQHRPAMNYSDMIFILTAKDSFAFSKPTAERRIREFLKFNLISKPICGLYSPRLRPFQPSPFDGNDP